MKKYILVLAIGFITVTSLFCQDKDIKNYKPVVSGDTSLIKMLKTYPMDTIKITKNERYILEAECWRDFMPTTDRGAYNGLVTSLYFKNLSDNIVDNTIVLQKEYVVYKDSVWLSNIPAKRDKKGSFVTAGGPLWSPNETIDIILQVKIKGAKYFISKKNVIIKRVD